MSELQYCPLIKHLSQKNKGNDHQLKKLLIVKQILLVRTLGNVCIENRMENMPSDVKV